MTAPVLVSDDGALGFWAALGEVFPDEFHVRGHEKVRTYGHEKSAPVATRSPQFWSSDVLTPR